MTIIDPDGDLNAAADDKPAPFEDRRLGPPGCSPANGPVIIRAAMARVSSWVAEWLSKTRPEPAYIITVSHPSPVKRWAFAQAYRFLLWGSPTYAVAYILATADGGRHALWMTLVASYVVLTLAMMTIDVRPDQTTT